MKLLRNKEILLPLALTAGMGVVSAGVCLAFDPRAGLVCLLFAAAACAVIVISERRRLKKMAQLSDDIDKMLSGTDSIDLSSYSEGEFGILRNELTKLTVKLREQTSELRNDKKLLADSIADISHQIRTPLTAINLLLAGMSESVDEEKRLGQLSELKKQLFRIDWLVSALLKLARLDADAVVMEQKSTALSALIRSALEPIDIQMELAEQTAVVEAEGCALCDPSWTAEALTNILKNCSEHMGAGSIFITASENPLYSQIIIRDTGSGFDERDLPHLFERFYRGRNSSGSGVGIGLALCRSIIARQNGSVKAENAKEGGACFTIRLYKSTV